MEHASIQSFWELVDQLLVPGRFSKSSVESLFDASLQRFDRNKFYDFYRGGPAVAHGVKIPKLELRLKRGATEVGLLELEVKEPCVTRTDIEKRLPGLPVVLPGGDSPNELIYFTAELHSRRLSFGFPQSDSLCLIRVIVEAPD